MRRRATFLAVAAAVAAGCASVQQPQDDPRVSPPVVTIGGGEGAPGRVVIDGSSGVIPLVAPLVAGYLELFPDADVTIGGGLGSRQRIPALVERKIDVALASHGIDLDELARAGLAAHRIALTPVVLAVNVSVGITGISEDEACAIFTGVLTSWRPLGGGELAIRAFARPESEVDTEVLRANIPCMRTATIAGTVMRVQDTPDMARAIEATTGAIGVTTANVVEASDGKIVALALGGVAPTPSNVERGRYRLTRAAYLVVHTPTTPAVAHFLAFVRSPRGAEIIAEAGSVSVK